MKLRLTVAPMMLGLAGCATMGDRPTEQMIAQQLTKERKLVHLTSTMSPEQLRQKAVETDCGKETKDITSIMPVVGTGSSVFRVDTSTRCNRVPARMETAG